jgi:hypothetical protein
MTMRISAKSVSIVVLLVAAVWVQAVVTRMPGAPGYPGRTREAVPGAERLAARWAAEYAERDLSAGTPIHLGFSRAFSKRFTKASGTVLLDFDAGRVTVAVKDLGPLPENAAYELWLVEQTPGDTNTAALDLGPGGDRILSLGSLPPSGALMATVGAKALATMSVDMATVVRISPGGAPEYVIGGMQSVRFQVGRGDQVQAPAFLVAGFGAPAAPAQKGGGKKLAALWTPSSSRACRPGIRCSPPNWTPTFRISTPSVPRCPHWRMPDRAD